MQEIRPRDFPGHPGEPGIEVRRPRPDVVRIELIGEHDLASSAALELAIDDALHQASHLVIDLTRVEFIDSTVINALVRACRRAEEGGGSFNVLVGPQAVVRLALEVTGVLGTVNAVESLDDAFQPDGARPGDSTNNGSASGRTEGGGRAGA